MADDCAACEIATCSPGHAPTMNEKMHSHDTVETALRAINDFISTSEIASQARSTRSVHFLLDVNASGEDIGVAHGEPPTPVDLEASVPEALTLPIPALTRAQVAQVPRADTPTLLGNTSPEFPKQSCWKGTRENKELPDEKLQNAKKKVSWYVSQDKSEGNICRGITGSANTSRSRTSRSTESTKSPWALRFFSASTINRIDSLTSVISRSRSSPEQKRESPKSPQTPRDNPHKLLQRRLTLKFNRLTQGQICQVFNLGKYGLQSHDEISGSRGLKLWWVLVGMFLLFMVALAATLNIAWYIDNQHTVDTFVELNGMMLQKVAEQNQDADAETRAAQLQTYMDTRTKELNDQSQQHLNFLIVVSCIIILVGVLLFGRFAQNKTRLLIRTVKRGTQAVANLDFDMCENLDDPEQGIVSTRQSYIREVIEMRDSFDQLANGLRSFAKYMDPYVVQLLVQSRRQATLGVAKADVTVFFSDIANFTTIAEAIDPSVFMEFFSVYLEEMSRIIMDCSGVVGEFIGDAIMAWWNVPVEVGEFHTRVALTAALLQQVKLAELRDNWIASGLPEVHSRMGLVRGDVLAGNIGSNQRMKYGLVGDSVNLASRLEGLCGRYGVNILIEQTSKMAPGVEEEFFLRPVDLVTVKGRTHPTELYEVVASKSDGPMAPTMGHELCTKYCDDFEHIQNLYRARSFEDALAAIDEYQKEFPKDKVAKTIRERCIALVRDPPGEDWTPVEKLSKKS